MRIDLKIRRRRKVVICRNTELLRTTALKKINVRELTCIKNFTFARKRREMQECMKKYETIENDVFLRLGS